MPKRRSSVIYFVESLKTGLIKIGYSAKLVDRLKTLKCEERGVILLATLDGGRAREAEVHDLFGQYRIKGEWFAPSPLLLEYIAASCLRHGNYSRPIKSLLEERIFKINGSVYYRLYQDPDVATLDRRTIGFLLVSHKIPLIMIGNVKFLDGDGIKRLKEAIVRYRSMVKVETFVSMI